MPELRTKSLHPQRSEALAPAWTSFLNCKLRGYTTVLRAITSR
jgi:hypothetical protein